MNRFFITRMLVTGLSILVATGLGQDTAPSPVPLTLRQAVTNALQNYPAIQVSQEQMNAAAAGIRLARTAYLPRVDALAQFNRATRNNVFGLLFPQNVIPSISGPVLGTNNFGTAWGSAMGTLVTWEPFDFGWRRANVGAANAARVKSDAGLKRTQFDVAVAAADAFLTLAAAQETVRAAEAGVRRAEASRTVVHALVAAELRPGADESRADAELAAARTQMIQAQQAVQIAKANLARFLGVEPTDVAIVTTHLLEMPPEQPDAQTNLSANPIALEQAATIEQAKAVLHALERSYFPKFYLQGSAYARGTGDELDGRLLGGLNGLAPNTQNYALGLTVTFPVTDKPAIEAREAAQSATVRAESARAKQIAADLRAQWNTAAATVQGARGIAANAPAELTAARAATAQATARYKAGVGNIEAVAETQRLLTQAEIDLALARLGVWRGLLGLAAAAGDLQPFLAEASQ